VFKSTVNKNQQTYSQKKINKLHQFPFDQNSYDLSREDKSTKKNSRLTGGKFPPLVIFHKSSLAGPCFYNRCGEIHGDTGEKKTIKIQKKN
jgi:hypothetical protein